MGRSKRIFAAALVLAILAGAPPPAHSQTAAEIDALAAQVDRLERDGKLEEAIDVAERVLAARERLLGNDNPSTFSSLIDLALLYSKQGRFAEAEALDAKAVDIGERVLGKEHPQTILATNNLALVHLSQGRFDEAEQRFTQVLAIAERVLPNEHPLTIGILNNLAGCYEYQARYEEAEQHFKRVLEVRERTRGKDHRLTINSVSVLAENYLHQGRYPEAERDFKRVLDWRERVLGKDDPETLISVNNLGELYYAQGRYNEAEPLYERAVKGRRRVHGEDHPYTILSLADLALLYKAQGRYAEAEPLARHVLAVNERDRGPQHPQTLVNRNNLATLYHAEGRYHDAEGLYKRVADASKQVFGEGHPFTLTGMNNLALLYQEQGRYEEAEPLFKQALAIGESRLGTKHPQTILARGNLALLYHIQGRYEEAMPIYMRTQLDRESVLGTEHPETLTGLLNLGALYADNRQYADAARLYEHALPTSKRVLGLEHPITIEIVAGLASVSKKLGRPAETERVYKQVLSSRERVLGKDHPATLRSMYNLGSFYLGEGRLSEAGSLLQRALDAQERVVGAEHLDVLATLSNLASVHFERGDFLRAAAFNRRSTAALSNRASRRRTVGQTLVGKPTGEAAWPDPDFQVLVKTVHRLAANGQEDPAKAAREMFTIAQRALSSRAAQALAETASRGAKNNPVLAAIVRERQDLDAEWQKRDTLRNAWLGEPTEQRNSKGETENAQRLATIDVLIAAIDKKLQAAFPDYDALVNPRPLSVEEAQSWLGDDEALVLFLDTFAVKPVPEETFIWVVTKTDMRWVRSDLGMVELAREVLALRCGLDEEEWATPTRSRSCANLLGLTDQPDKSQPLPFDLGRAHGLYRALFGQIEDMIAGKRLLIVPSGALTSLPLHVLVTRNVPAPLPKSFEGYRDVSWFGKQNALVTLPSVSSLISLRRRAPRQHAASASYAGYGNPVLSGDGPQCRQPKPVDACPPIGEPRAAARQATTPDDAPRATIGGGRGARSTGANINAVFSKGSTSEAILDHVRALCPLPDTAQEIKCVAARFNERESVVRLAGEATEAELKAMSDTGRLARYGVLHFATHGLLSGDVESITKRRGEAALVLTPPQKPGGPSDDGLLTASEIAGLQLDADWVVLSACNTAGSDDITAEALSGLASAFFYAGGRALLVSHWPVYSDAAVRLTTQAFAELGRDAKTGRAEALQSAMLALMNDHSQADNAHPAVWAPFVVVGEGAR